MKQYLIAGLLCLAAANMQAQQQTAAHGDPIDPVPFTSVKITDSFWGQRLEASRTTTIPLAFSKCEECQNADADLSAKAMFIMAVATSIDALAVGISLAMAGDVSIVLAVVLIGVTTFCLSALGVKVGNVFGSRYEKKAQIAGGVILILLGLKILLEHLGILG